MTAALGGNSSRLRIEFYIKSTSPSEWLQVLWRARRWSWSSCFLWCCKTTRPEAANSAMVCSVSDQVQVSVRAALLFLSTARSSRLRVSRYSRVLSLAWDLGFCAVTILVFVVMAPQKQSFCGTSRENLKCRYKEKLVDRRWIDK